MYLAYKNQIQKLQKKLELPIHSNSKPAMKPDYRKPQPLKQHTINSILMKQQQQQQPSDTQSSSLGKENEIVKEPRLQPKKIEKPSPASTSSEPIESTRARHERIHMHGETCIACERVSISILNFLY